VQAKERSYETMVHFGKQGLSIAATAAVTAAVKASGVLFDRRLEMLLRRCRRVFTRDDSQSQSRGRRQPHRMGCS